jgi:hypothetical protein
MISVIHLFVVLFVVLTPFFGNNYVLLIHAIMIPFIILHWIANDNSCILTTIEMQLRKQLYGNEINKSDCLTCNIISPIYDVTNNYEEYSLIIYVVTLLLWATAVSKLILQYKEGKIKDFCDIFSPREPLYSIF